MADKKRAFVNNILTPIGRLIFTHVSKPDSGREFSDDKYKVTLLIPKEKSLAKLKDAVLACAKEAFGSKITKLSQIQHPFRNGEDKADKYPVYADTNFIVPKSTRRPKVLDRNRQELDADEIYGGCFARLGISACSYMQAGKPGVTFLLDAIQKTGDGDAIGGGGGGGGVNVSMFDDGEIERYDEGADDPNNYKNDDIAAADDGDIAAADDGDDDDDAMFS
jgi:hypothetical protein